MTLRNRIARLETRKAPPDPRGDPQKRLAAMLARIENVVVASGDALDRPGASPIERAVRRYLRGDASIGDALRDLLARR